MKEIKNGTGALQNTDSDVFYNISIPHFVFFFYASNFLMPVCSLLRTD